MSTCSESESEPELATETVSSLTAFAHLSATQQYQNSTDRLTVSWAVDTLATLDFRLVRKDTALHGLVQSCASTMLTLFNNLLGREPITDRSCNFIADVASILRPSFLQLLFQYRRLFRVFAARDFKSNSAPLAIVCWVDVILAKLSDVIAFIAAGLDQDDLDQSLPESLRVQRKEDNLRAAMQLPDNWDMLPSMLLSERASVAAKRLSTRLMLGGYVLCPALSGQVGMDDTIHKLLSTFAEFIRQSAAQVDGLCSGPEPGLRYFIQQQRLTGAMAISLFAVADMAQVSVANADHPPAFRPQTMAAVMRLLRFVLDEGGIPTQTSILSPVDHLDIPSSVIIRWGIVPRWAWSLWLEYRCLYADTIMSLTTTYIQYHGAKSEALLKVSDLSLISVDTTVISVVIDILFRFISVLSDGGHSMQLSVGMTRILHESCYLVSLWMNQNTCGIQNSKECCKALIALFGYLSRGAEYFALNDLVLECLALTRRQCTCDAWKAAVEDNNFRFLEALGQRFTETKTALFRTDITEWSEVHVTQLMQFLVIAMSRRVEPFDLDASTEFIQAVGERILDAPLNGRDLLRETFLVCLAVANMTKIDLPVNKVPAAADEAIWHLGMCNRGVNIYMASAFSLYISSTPVNVEPLTYLEGLEDVVDTILLICSGHHSGEDKALAWIVLPTICNALAHLLKHVDDVTRIYTWTNAKMSALLSILRSLDGGLCPGDPECGELLKRHVLSAARRVLHNTEQSGAVASKYELVFCRQEERSHMMYVRMG